MRVRGGWYGLHRLVRNRRRALALGLAVTAAALVAAGPEDGAPARSRSAGGAPVGAPHSANGPVRQRPTAGAVVEAPVRIADAETVRLLRPGDRVDVIAAEQSAGGAAHVVARGARVTKVPEPLGPAGGEGDGGALVVLSVPHATAARLAGASTTVRLAVTVW